MDEPPFNVPTYLHIFQSTGLFLNKRPEGGWASRVVCGGFRLRCRGWGAGLVGFSDFFWVFGGALPMLYFLFFWILILWVGFLPSYVNAFIYFLRLAVARPSRDFFLVRLDRRLPSLALTCFCLNHISAHLFPFSLIHN